ncbi:S8 family serine peptidase [Sinorhizobium meliloti]|nr:S8 family serine peptidase [Sinorhizobium meliloti]MDW9943434.1 S8 family serine peptidase [Sinorhizobium meliloti]
MARPRRTRHSVPLVRGKSSLKLDPRLAYLAQLPISALRRLKDAEDRSLHAVARRIGELKRSPDEAGARRFANELRKLDAQLFAPLSAGVHLPYDIDSRFNEPFFSVFVQGDASASRLNRLGAMVRFQSRDIFTAFLPRSALQALQRSPTIRFIELARPWFYDLNTAIPFTQINTLHAAPSPVNGTNVIVGVIDSPLDIYHPDFRTGNGQSRLLFLWDQTLIPQAGESGPPVAPALPGFMPRGGATYGVEYNQAEINAELDAFAPPDHPAYQIVRHQPQAPLIGFPISHLQGHGTFVTGCAAGNGLGGGGFVGGAPASTIIFVNPLPAASVQLAADSVAVLDACAYIFARAEQAGLPCVINLSASDNQGPHDGTTLGEQFLDGLLTVPGRAITLSAGNSTGSKSHAAGTVAQGETANLSLQYRNPTFSESHQSDDVEIWYDGHDRFSVTVTAPTVPPTVVGTIFPGESSHPIPVGGHGTTVAVSSILNDPRNGDNLISVIITVPDGQIIPAGDWTIALTGIKVVNGAFNAWVDRNNRGSSAWQPPFLQETQLTLGVPSTARRLVTVGNHDKTAPTPNLAPNSGLGPTRDGRIKPEIATIGTNVTAPSPRNMNAAPNRQPLYQSVSGTSFSAPIVAGACALLLQCRPDATWIDLKRILTDAAGSEGLVTPNNGFGFGFLQIGEVCAAPANKMAREPWLTKLDPRLQARLDSATAADLTEVVHLLVLVRGPIEDLESLDFKPGTQVGEVVLGHAPIGAITKMAQHSSIAYIELSRSLDYDR